jgi:hypothetical protein
MLSRGFCYPSWTRFRRGGRIRTYDLHIPNVARYRATLHPEGEKYGEFAVPFRAANIQL